MSKYAPLTKERLDKLLVKVGHAINANNGRCGLIEDALIETTTLICQVSESLSATSVNAELLAVCKECRVILIREIEMAKALQQPPNTANECALASVEAAIAKHEGQ